MLSPRARNLKGTAAGKPAARERSSLEGERVCEAAGGHPRYLRDPSGSAGGTWRLESTFGGRICTEGKARRRTSGAQFCHPHICKMAAIQGVEGWAPEPGARVVAYHPYNHPSVQMKGSRRFLSFNVGQLFVLKKKGSKVVATSPTSITSDHSTTTAPLPAHTLSINARRLYPSQRHRRGPCQQSGGTRSCGACRCKPSTKTDRHGSPLPHPAGWGPAPREAHSLPSGVGAGQSRVCWE